MLKEALLGITISIFSTLLAFSLDFLHRSPEKLENIEKSSIIISLQILQFSVLRQSPNSSIFFQSLQSDSAAIWKLPKLLFSFLLFWPLFEQDWTQYWLTWMSTDSSHLLKEQWVSRERMWVSKIQKRKKLCKTIFTITIMYSSFANRIYPFGLYGTVT